MNVGPYVFKPQYGNYATTSFICKPEFYSGRQEFFLSTLPLPDTWWLFFVLHFSIHSLINLCNYQTWQLEEIIPGHEDIFSGDLLKIQMVIEPIGENILVNQCNKELVSFNWIPGIFLSFWVITVKKTDKKSGPFRASFLKDWLREKTI